MRELAECARSADIDAARWVLRSAPADRRAEFLRSFRVRGSGEQAEGSLGTVQTRRIPGRPLCQGNEGPERVLREQAMLAGFNPRAVTMRRPVRRVGINSVARGEGAAPNPRYGLREGVDPPRISMRARHWDKDGLPNGLLRRRCADRPSTWQNVPPTLCMYGSAAGLEGPPYGPSVHRQCSCWPFNIAHRHGGTLSKAAR